MADKTPSAWGWQDGVTGLFTLGQCWGAIDDASKVFDEKFAAAAKKGGVRDALFFSASRLPIRRLPKGAAEKGGVKYGVRRADVCSSEWVLFDIESKAHDQVVKQAEVKTWMDAIESTCEFLGNSERYYVATGGGMHLSVRIGPIANTLGWWGRQAPAYLELRSMIDRALADNGHDVRCDPAVWGPNRLIRIPGFVNRKRGVTAVLVGAYGDFKATMAWPEIKRVPVPKSRKAAVEGLFDNLRDREGTLDRNGYMMVRCPFHEEETPSMLVYMDGGGWALDYHETEGGRPKHVGPRELAMAVGYKGELGPLGATDRDIPITVRDDGYYLVPEEGDPLQLSNWTFNPTLVIRGMEEDCDVIEGIYTAGDFRTETWLAHPHTWTGTGGLMADMCRHAGSYWRGAMRDAQTLSAKISSAVRACPVVYASRVSGAQDLRLVTKTAGPPQLVGVARSGSSLPDIRVDSTGGFVDSVLWSGAPDTHMDDECAEGLLHFNHPAIVSRTLAWAAAAFACQAIREHVGSFPLMLYSGLPGCGKTSTALRIICALHGIRTPPQSLASKTNFGLLSELASTWSLPIIYEDWQSARDRTIIDRIARMSYDGTESSRGTRTLGRRVFRSVAPVVLCGEDTPTDSGTLSRSVLVQMQHARPDGSAEAWNKIAPRKMLFLGRMMFRNLHSQWLEIPKRWDRCLDEVPRQLEDRLRTSYATLHLGLGILNEAGLRIDPNALYTDQVTPRNVSPMDAMIDYFTVACMNADIRAGLQYRVNGDELLLWIPGVMAGLREAGRRQGINLPLSEIAFKRQLEQHPGFLSTRKLIRIGDKPRRCHSLAISKLPEELRQAVGAD